MHVIQGKHNVAKIMMPDDLYPDQETISQIYTFLNHPAFKGKPVVIMPDTHAGKGAVIGFTMPLNDYVIPNVVGVDIGCGMIAWDIPKDKSNIDFAKFDNFIRSNIPSGHSIRDRNDKFVWYSKGLGLDRMVAFGSLADRINQKVDTEKSLGSLGGGNHFIEIVEHPDSGQRTLVIHSGSRNLGLKVCEYHQQIAKKLMNTMFIGDAYKNLEFLPKEDQGWDYLDDMETAQDYASVNRHCMLERIAVEFFGIDLPAAKYKDTYWECVHNYIDMKHGIVRKGAISAQEGEKVIIPLNMRDGIIFGTGKGNKEWNYSAPHGAGRILSRKRAKEELNLEEVKESMSGVWTSSLSEKTIDEAPQAYKDASMIIQAIADTVDVTSIAKPVYNFKAS